jgi:hypothetical protein
LETEVRIVQTNDSELPNAVVSEKNGVISATVFSGTQVLSYEQVPGSTDYVIQTVDVSQYQEDNPVQVPSFVPRFPAAMMLQAAGSSPPKVKLLVVYTPAAIKAEASLVQSVSNAVAFTNQGILGSGQSGSLKLKGVVQVNYLEQGGSSGIDKDLTWVQQSSEVAALREQFHADLVHLVIEGDPTKESCGTSFIMSEGLEGAHFKPFAFSVSKRLCMRNNNSLAHEVLHDLGLTHNPEDSGGTIPADPKGCGHRIPGKFRDVMSYESPQGESRVMRVSSLRTKIDGIFLGTDECNAVTTLDHTMLTASLFYTDNDQPIPLHLRYLPFIRN